MNIVKEFKYQDTVATFYHHMYPVLLFGFLTEFLPTPTSYFWYTGIPHPFLAEDTLTAIAFNIRMTLNSTAKIFLRTKIFTVVVSVSKHRIGNSFLTLPL